MDELELLRDLGSHDVDAWRKEKTRIRAHEALKQTDLPAFIALAEPVLACAASAVFVTWAFATVVAVLS